MMRANKATAAGESVSNRVPDARAQISIVHERPKHSPRNKRIPRQSNALSDRVLGFVMTYVQCHTRGSRLKPGEWGRNADGVCIPSSSGRFGGTNELRVVTGQPQFYSGRNTWLTKSGDYAHRESARVSVKGQNAISVCYNNVVDMAAQSACNSQREQAT